MVFNETKNKAILEYWTMVLWIPRRAKQETENKISRMLKKMSFSTQSLSVHMHRKIRNTKTINFESKQENHCMKNFSCIMIADMLNAYKGLRIKHD